MNQKTYHHGFTARELMALIDEEINKDGWTLIEKMKPGETLSIATVRAALRDSVIRVLNGKYTDDLCDRSQKESGAVMNDEVRRRRCDKAM